MTYYVTPLMFFGGCLLLKTMSSSVYLSLSAMGFYTHYNQFPGVIQCSGAPTPPPWASFSLGGLPYDIASFLRNSTLGKNRVWLPKLSSSRGPMLGWCPEFLTVDLRGIRLRVLKFVSGLMSLTFNFGLTEEGRRNWFLIVVVFPHPLPDIFNQCK